MQLISWSDYIQTMSGVLSGAYLLFFEINANNNNNNNNNIICIT